MQLPPSLIILTALLLDVSFGQHTIPHHGHRQHQNQTVQDEVTCHPFGICEPCPDTSLQEPFCQPFGNRRLLHCTPTSMAHNPDHSDRPSRIPEKTNEMGGSSLAWESCGRIVAKERADFWEFVLSNVLFAGIALAVFFVRSKRMAAMQARNLAARIGLVSGRGDGS